MNRSIVLLVFLGLISVMRAQKSAPVVAPLTLIRAGVLIDGVSESARRDKVGEKVACHAYGGEGLQRALDGGCDSIEHGLVLTDAQIAQMIRQGTWLCATLSIYYDDWAPADTAAGQRDRKRASAHEESFRKAVKAGVKIAFGTDMGGMPWTEPIAQEFPRIAEFGMTPMQTIRARLRGQRNCWR